MSDDAGFEDITTTPPRVRPGERIPDAIAREFGLDAHEEAAQGFLYFSNVILRDSLEDQDQDETFLLDRARRTTRLYAAIREMGAPVAVHPVPATGRGTVMLTGLTPRLLCPCHLLPYGCHVSVDVAPDHSTIDWQDLGALVYHVFSGVTNAQDAAQKLVDIIDDALAPAGVAVTYRGEMWCSDADTLPGPPRSFAGRTAIGEVWTRLRHE